MEKSIENIWKEGFLKKDALVAPKINNLYTKKSIHIIDKFKRMFKMNLIAIVVFSFCFLIVSFFVGIPITGVLFFAMLSVLVVINKKLLDELNSIELELNSYQYLKVFDQWIKKQISTNEKFSKFLYPSIFIAMVLGFWFKDAEGEPLGHRLVNEILIGFPDTYMLFGVPLVGILVCLVIVWLLAFYGGKIYRWDLHIVYGRVLHKLEELIADIESLRA